MTHLRQESWKRAAAQAYFLVCAIWFAAVVSGTTAVRFHRVLLVIVGSYGVAAALEAAWRWARRGGFPSGRW